MAGETDLEAQAERVAALEAELENAAEISLKSEELAASRRVLTSWVETVVGVVASPGVGRVTLIHADGSQSSIASRTLPFLLSRPARFGSE